MLSLLASDVMPRTTIDLDEAVLRDLKRLQKRERKSLGRLISELVTAALARPREREQVEPLAWTARPMGARVDLEDEEAVRAALDAT